MSTGTRINELLYTDGTGAMQLQTRFSPYLQNNGTLFLQTNILMTPTGQVVVGAEDQSDVLLHRDDGFVVNGNFRLIPLEEEEIEPTCNEVTRGTLILKPIAFSCASGIGGYCYHDELRVCVKLQNYAWVPLSDSELVLAPYIYVHIKLYKYYT